MVEVSLRTDSAWVSLNPELGLAPSAGDYLTVQHTSTSFNVFASDTYSSIVDSVHYEALTPASSTLNITGKVL